MTRQMKKIAIAACTSLLIICSNSAIAKPGTLASTPLFVSDAVEPNVFFTVDDSGSMELEVMVDDGTNGITTSKGKPVLYGREIKFYNAEFNSDCGVMPPESLMPGSWVFRNHIGNKVYYNPDTTYIPWSGLDANSDALYTNADPLKAKEFAYDGASDTMDLTKWHDFTFYTDRRCRTRTKHTQVLYIPTYAIWPDDEGDGVIEETDNHTIVEIAAGSAEMQNFANWFQYYRSREYSAKSAMGRVINNMQSTRSGLDVFNDGHQVDVSSMSIASNKLNLLTAYYGASSGGGTPAHDSFKRVGELFKRTTGTRPILDAGNGGECQQNFNILMTDGFWSDYNTSPNVGNADSSSDNTGYDGDASESNDGGNYEDSWSNTLADVAMHYYENDLRSDLTDRVPPQAGVDEATHQHLVTYSIGFGVIGNLDPDVDDPDTGGANFWPNPMDDKDEDRVDDLWHAAYNSRGEYLSASNPAELEASLGSVITNIASRTATAAAASVTSAKLTTESIVYLAEFNTSRWQGTIYAHKILNLDTGELNPTPEWSASEELNNRDLNSSPRVILTFDGVTTNDGIPFQWTNDLTTAMKNDLRTNAKGGTDSDTIAEARLDYIRGDRSNESAGQSFRVRTTILGDIINSGPVYVGKPDLNWPDSFPVGNVVTPYSDFKVAQEKRKGVVYVGANDGMLHGFDESSGKELIAYVPGNLFSTTTGKGLHYLTEQAYSHQFYNDLTPSVSDIYINGSWTTVLISGQRAGGRGYYALDVTNPASFKESAASSTVMWEFTSDDDADLGFTYSKPQIAMANNGKWVAIFGNGYNDTGTTGEAKLFIVDIQAGIDGSWSTGDYKVITTGSGTISVPNGLGTPTLADLDQNGTIDRVYAGDLNGNMWAFDLSGATDSSWVLAAEHAGSPLFVTDGALPITAKPILAFHPTEPNSDSNAPNVMVYFGSGQYLVESDKSSTNDHYFYGVWDKGTAGLTRSNLVEQTYRSGFVDSSGNPARVLTQNSVDYDTYYGWNISLPDSGERSVTTPAVRGNVVFFNSSVPTADPCSTGGYGYRFAVDAATGGTPDEPVLDTNKDGVIDDQDTIGNDLTVQSADKLGDLPTDNTFTEKVGYTGKDPFAIKELDTPNIGRFSWQELLK